MPVWKYITYMSGYMPGDDVDAQRRCMAFLRDAITLAEDRAADLSQGDETSRQVAKSQSLTLASLESLLSQWAPTYRWKPAQSFWKYWDRNKRQIIAAHENSHSDSDYMRAVGVLEEGRYYND